MMMNKHRRRMGAMAACLLLTICSLVPAAAEPLDIDPLKLGDVVILEDATLIDDLEEYLKNVLDMPLDEIGVVTETTVENDSGEAMAEPDDEPDPPITEPAEAAYDIQMEVPGGWYLNRAVMEMTIVDTGGTGWASVRITMERDSGTVTLVDGPLPSGHIWIDLLENCMVVVTVTDPQGEQHRKQVTVACFDKENPTLSTSIQDEFLHIEATDEKSGIASVQVNGTTYTELEEGKLVLWLKEYADAYEQLIVQAMDNVGNVSKALAVANPFFRHKSTPTPKPTSAPKPTNTPKPTKKPSDGGGGSSGSTTTASPTPTATVSPTPSPEVISVAPTPQATIDTGFPFSLPGNSFTRDLLYNKYTNKQFIAIETRGGDVFYIVIDYDKPLDEKGERYETYFLNLVDSRDMLDIVGDAATPEPEVVYVTPEPTAQPTPEPVPIPEPEKKDGGGALLGIISILVAAGGGAVWYFKIRKPNSGKSKPEYDYEFDDEDEDDGEDEEMVTEDE